MSKGVQPLLVWQGYQRAVKVITVGVLAVMLSACQRQPPAQRAVVNLPAYQQGDTAQGKKLYDQHCKKCHSLTPGSNEKGPQLVGVYGAHVADLTDYQFTDALRQSQLTWTADNLDRYLADPRKAVPGTRMRSEPIAEAQVRHDIIAYLSTLR